MNDHEQPRFRHRSSSAGRQTALQIRASNLVRKLGILTSKLGAGARIKADTGKHTDNESANYPYRKTRSMDILRSKPYMSSPMLTVGFQSQTLARPSADGSHESGSDDDAGRVGKASLGSGSIAQGLAVAAVVAEAGLRPPERRPNSVANSSNVTNNTTDRNTNLSLESPPPPRKRPGHPRLSTLPPLNFNSKGTMQDQGTSRFSPSLIVRPPPFPIFELPALPTPVAETPASDGQAPSRTGHGAQRLNSMPMLPMEGPDERENDSDHENYGLDEDEEGDDEDNDDERTGEAVGSDDEDEGAGTSGRTSSFTGLPSPTASLFARTRALSPRLAPNFSTLLGGVRAGGGTGAGSSSASLGHSHADPAPGIADVNKFSKRDELATPKAETSLNGNGSARWDYFSTSLSTGPASAEHIDLRAESSSSSSPSYPHAPSPSQSSALRTPTARDYPASQTPMISVAPPPPPWTESETSTLGSDVRPLKGNLTTKSAGVDVPHLALSDSPKRPGIYHHASKSMVELFSSAPTPTRGADTLSIGSGVADRDIKGKGKLRPEESVTNLQVLMTSPNKGKATKDKKGADTLLAASSDANAKALEKALPSAPTTAAPNDPNPSLRRQRSMPTFSVSGPPPPYPAFAFPEHMRRFAPVPREDEGKEVLPPYSNAIRLTAVMPRKMEFSAPGVPARDRKWRRVHCVLEGTAFRVYDAPPRVSGVSAFGGWWERKVGVGDVSAGQGGAASAGPGATTNIIIGRKEPKRRMKWEEELQAEEAAQRAEVGSEEVQASTTEVNLGGHAQGHKSKLHLAASLLHPNRSRNTPVHAPSSLPASPRSSLQTPRTSAESSAPPSARPSVDLSTPASSSSVLSSTAVSASGSTSVSSASLSGLSTNSGASSSGTQTWRRGHVRSHSTQSTGSHSRSNSRSQSQLNPDLQSQNSNQNLNQGQSQSNLTPPDPDERDLLRVYSLQRAESGLASDYTKRKNVVRVRMEGEQFLLQCTDVAGVVEWIEGLQAATNIALDLDERPMPKGPIFPRRRRRRRVQRTDAGTEQPAAGAAAAAGSGTNEVATS